MLLPSVTFVRRLVNWSLDSILVVIQPASAIWLHVAPVNPLAQIQLQALAVTMLVPPLAHGVEFWQFVRSAAAAALRLAVR